MKRLVILLIAIVTLVSCSKEELPKTNFELKITQQPVGGLNLSTVSSAYTGTIKGYVQPVRVLVEWFVESQYHENAMQLSATNVNFTEGTTVAKTTASKVSDPYFSHPVYYWVRFTWTDSNGTHTLDSQKVFCERK